MMSPWGRGGG